MMMIEFSREAEKRAKKGGESRVQSPESGVQCPESSRTDFGGLMRGGQKQVPSTAEDSWRPTRNASGEVPWSTLYQ